MLAISQVLENYLTTHRNNGGVARRNDSVDQRALLEGIPNIFRNLLTKQGRIKDFKVEGSIGNGNMPKVPWVGIFNNLVTSSAQEGYYIVLLFSEDMQSCYLSLNQGVTELRTQYGQSLANTKMITAAKRALQFFDPRPDALVGKIALNASSHLGKAYECGAIESHKYQRNALPSDTWLDADFASLLDHYDRLVSVAGPSLQFLAPVTEDEFHQAAMKKALSVDLDDKEATGALPVPPITNTSSPRFVRNVRYAAIALKRADFRCEIDVAHETFLTRAGNKNYVEAHHLVPMSRQNDFTKSLDHPANIVALCTNCHKLLHHGRSIDKHDHLIRLFEARKALLETAKIGITANTLLSFYSGNLLEHE